MFTYIKELFNLIAMLFKSNPDKVDRLEIVKFKYFPFKGYSAMSWCGNIITRDPDKISEITINHEKIHLYQAKLLGSWFKYYLKYVWEWLKGNPTDYPAISAYYTIPFEVEAYANETDFNYCDDYDGKNLLERYTLEHRKKLYNSVGGLVSDWKKYIKKL